MLLLAVVLVDDEFQIDPLVLMGHQDSFHVQTRDRQKLSDRHLKDPVLDLGRTLVGKSDSFVLRYLGDQGVWKDVQRGGDFKAVLLRAGDQLEVILRFATVADEDLSYSEIRNIFV